MGEGRERRQKRIYQGMPCREAQPREGKAPLEYRRRMFRQGAKRAGGTNWVIVDIKNPTWPTWLQLAFTVSIHFLVCGPGV